MLEDGVLVAEDDFFVDFTGSSSNKKERTVMLGCLEIDELYQKIKLSYDIEASKIFWRECRKFVSAIIKDKFKFNIDPDDLEDLQQQGMLGILVALKRFNPEKKILFRSFAEQRVGGMMVDLFRQRFGRNGQKIIPESLDGLFEDNETFDVPDPNSIDPSYFSDYEKVKQYIEENLTPDQQFVLEGHYFEDKNLKQIGDLLNLSESRICQLHSEALAKIKRHFRSFQPLFI